MILLVLIIAVLCFFISYIYVESTKKRLTLTLISAVLIILSTVAIVANFTSHFGMEKVISYKQQRIYPARTVGENKLILYKQLGTDGTEKVWIYSLNESSEKTVHTQANLYTRNQVIRSDKSYGYFKTTETRWEYKSIFYRLLFGIAQNNKLLIKRENILILPHDWQIVRVEKEK